jgi:CubicO group peptidase (beta-lactamase class C family)
VIVAEHYRTCRLIASLAFATALFCGAADPSGPGLEAAPPATRETHVRPQLLQPGDPRAHGLTDADLEGLSEILCKVVDDHTVPGVSLLLAHKGEVIYKKAFGNLTVDHKALMASSSKPVTATILMILVDQGKLSLDEPVEKYLPEFKGITINGRRPAKLPTVRHLLCNMSGLPGDFLAESLLKRLRNGAGKAQDEIGTKQSEKDSSEMRFAAGGKRSLADSVRDLAKRGLATEPGAEFHYCTMGFNVAARVAEVAAQRPFEELSRTELFEPMGMKNTRYTPLGLQAFSSRPTLSNGESRFIIAGGGMTSTLDDFAAFYQMHLNGGTYRNRRILSEDSAAAMHTRQAKLELLMAGPYGNDYGVAFFLNHLDGNGEAHSITHPGLFGTTPWFDKDRELVGILFVQSNFLRVMSLVRDVQTKVRTIIKTSAR